MISERRRINKLIHFGPNLNILYLRIEEIVRSICGEFIETNK